MVGSLNRVDLIGNLGRDPEIRSMQNGDKVAHLSIATSERWKDKNSGETREKTEWHRVIVWGKLVELVVEPYLTKGSKILVTGKLQTRKWNQDGQDRYTTEVVVQGYDGKLTMLDGRKGEGGDGSEASSASSADRPSGGQSSAQRHDDLDSEIPF